MTNLIDLELTTMKANELREIAKEFQMVGSWKAKKQEMIEFLETKKLEQIDQDEVDFIDEVVEVELEKPKPVKPIKQNKIMREIILFDDKDNFVAEFKNQSEAVKYCEKERLCNGGWVVRSVRTSEKFYFPNGRRSKSKNSKYSGAGWFTMKKAELIKQEA